MKANQRSLWPALLVYGIGVIAGLFLIVVSTWADVESSSYNFPRLANAGLDGLHCPVLMTPDETSQISLDVSNPTDNQLTPSIRTQISTPLLPEEFLENVQLIPGEKKRLEWTVDDENIDMGYFIFAKVLLFSAYPIPSREATCGILILDLPVTGKVIVPVLVGLSLIGMGWGLYRINKLVKFNSSMKRHRSSMVFLALLIGLGLIFSYTGGWIPSVLVVVVSLLLVIILLGSVFSDQPR